MEKQEQRDFPLSDSGTVVALDVLFVITTVTESCMKWKVEYLHAVSTQRYHLDHPVKLRFQAQFHSVHGIISGFFKDLHTAQIIVSTLQT